MQVNVIVNLYFLITNTDCNTLSKGNANFYPDCSSCDFDYTTYDLTCKGCVNGYFISEEIGCQSTCPFGYYGAVEYSKRGMLESSTCLACNND